MSFADKTYEDRKRDTMWDTSEKEFERTWQGPWFRYGLSDGADDMAAYRMPSFIRSTPDYIAAMNDQSMPFLLEVQGTGGHALPRTHKFKKAKMEDLGEWDKKHTVLFWLWDDQEKTWFLVSYRAVRLAILRGMATEGSFDGKRPYWAIEKETLIEIGEQERLFELLSGR